MIETLNAIPLASLMLIITVGYGVGQLSVRQLALGPAGGTLFVALVCGQLGLSTSQWAGNNAGFSLGTFGFALFIYSVGFEAGPRFFTSLRDQGGWRFVAVASTVNLLALAVAVACGRLLALDPATAAGALAGALTSAPTFAAASEITQDSARLSVAFALTYPLGLVGLVLLIQLLPGRLGDELSRDAADETESLLGQRGTRRFNDPRQSPEETRAYEATHPEVLGPPLRELKLTQRTGCVLSRIRHGDQLLVAGADTVLAMGDRVMATGRIDELRNLEALVGPEVFDSSLQERLPPPRRIQIRQPEVVGRTLAELRISNRYRCVITRIERGDLLMEPDAQTALCRHDLVEVVGQRDDVRRLARFLGRFEPAFAETNIAVYALGILCGIVLGRVQLPMAGFNLTLGMAGGLLVSGLVLGWLRRLGPFRAEVPRQARQLARDLGILLFVSEIGLDAGHRMLDGLTQFAWKTLATGLAVTLLTVLGSLIFALLLLRLRPIDAWGSVCGGLTSSAALQAVRRAADSNEAAVSYAVSYAVGSVLATLAGQLVVALM